MKTIKAVIKEKSISEESSEDLTADKIEEEVYDYLDFLQVKPVSP